MAIARVLISDPVADECVALLRDAVGIEPDYRPKLPPAELLACIGDYDGLIVRSGTQVTADVIGAGEKLRVVARAGVGVDNVDVDAATRRGVLVMNAPEGNTVSAAEHAIALMFAAARHIAAADASTRAGKWERGKFLGTQLTGKTLGLLGLGRVGREVAKRARGLEMDVVASDPMVSEEQARRWEVELAPPDEVIARADVLSVHVPLTDRTRGLVGAAEMARMKPGAIIVNAARGGVVDEAALAAALAEGKVAAAGIDVYAEEPPPGDNPVLTSPHTSLTPHLGASTREAQELVGVLTARQVVGYLRDGSIVNAVNMFRIDPKVAARIAPWQDLGEKLGSLQAQLLHGAIERIEITTAGDALDDESKPILARAVLTGFFRHFLEAPVNYVNVAHFAREKGIRLVESAEDDARGFRDLLTVEVTTSKGSRRLAGTIFGERRPRIVFVDDYMAEVRPEGHMVLFANDDTPGIMGMAGSLLGKNGVNIAYMSMGRDAEGGTALAVLGIDGPMPDAVLEKLAASKGIVWARRVAL